MYEGIHTTTTETAAVKVLLAALDDDSEQRQRFEAEIDTLKRLRHPNIVRLFGFGEEQGRLYYVMEMVDGPSLYQEIRRHRLFQWHEVAKVGLEMCAALKHGHDRGITHRDIKPANILLDQNGSIKLSDYGIAHFFGGQRLTEAHSVVGTLEYMSPEQALAHPVGSRSDLYSLGAVLYGLLMGHPPFAAKNLAEIVQKHQRGAIESIRSARLDAPDELETIIFDLLKLRPEDRPHNAHLVAKRLQSLLLALFGPPESIQVKPMTPDSPTVPPVVPARVSLRGEEEPEKKIGSPRGIVVDDGIIDLGGIVDAGDVQSEPTSASPNAGGVNEGSALADSFSPPGNHADAKERTIGMALPSASSELTVRKNPAKPSQSNKPDIAPPGIRHGELYLNETTGMRRSKDEPIPDYSDFMATKTAPHAPPPAKQDGDQWERDEMIAPSHLHGTETSCGTARNPAGFAIASAQRHDESDPLASPNDHPTVDGFQTGRRPEQLAASLPVMPLPRKNDDNLPEQRKTSSLQTDSVSRFIAVTDEDRDNFETDERANRPIISLQTVFASCCLILTGLVTYFMLQPVPPDVQYERITKALEDNTERGFSLKALRQNEDAIKLFLLDHPQYPQAELLRFYLDQLELDKLERDIARRLQTTDAGNMLPAQRAYMEAMSSEKTAPNRTIVKLRALIDLYRSDARLLNEATEAAESEKHENASTSSLVRRSRRGSIDEDFVFLATRQLERLERDIEKINAEQLAKLTLRLRDAQTLKEQHPERAQAIWRAVIELYQDHPWAADVVQEARDALGRPSTTDVPNGVP